VISELKGAKKYAIDMRYKRDALFVMSFFCLYFLIAALHFYNRNALGILQHDIRNIIWYSPIILFLPYYIKDNNDVRRLINFIIYNGALIGIIGLISKLFNIDFILYDEGRVLSTLGNPNNLAFFLNILIFVILSRILVEKRINKKFILALGIFILCAFLTLSLGGVLSLFVGTILVLLLTQKIRRGAYVISFMVIFGMVILNFGFLDGTIVKCYQVTDRNSDCTSLYGRTQQFQEIWRVLRSEDIICIALGSFKLETYKKYDSQYWNIFRNNGLLLLIYLLVIFSYVIRIGVRKAKCFIHAGDTELGGSLLGISAALLSMLIVSFNLTAFLNRFPLNFLIYLIIGLVLMINTQEVTKYSRTFILKK